MTLSVRCRVAASLALVLTGLALFAAPPALALPEGRAYEMVSPVYKAGYGVGAAHEIIVAVAPDGESVAFASLGSFAGALSNLPGGNTYLARRGPSGWSTAALQPPFGGRSDFSASLDETLASGPLGANSGVENNTTEAVFQLHRNDAPNTAQSWEVAGGMVFKSVEGGAVAPGELGASSDLCHVVTGHTGAPLLPAAVNTAGQIYDFARGCGGEPSLRLVGLNNKGKVINSQCSVGLGLDDPYQGVGQEPKSSFNAVSTGGNDIFFTTSVEKGSNCTKVHQLFLRLDGTRTLEISKPTSEACAEVPCAGAPTRASAYFKGASEDGSRVYFTTAAPLSGGDGDEGNDLYMATIGCPLAEPQCEASARKVTSLVQVSHDPTASEAAEVQGVVTLAPDGSRVYFVARGILGEGPNSEGTAPLKGADNLYAYDSASGKTAFVADLCSGPDLSGLIEDLACPGDLSQGEFGKNDLQLWTSLGREVQTAGSGGSVLIFSTYAQLLRNDTDNAKDVYRYEAQGETLDRVSLGEAGYDANGNRDDSTQKPTGADAGINAAGSQSNQPLVYLQREMGTRAASEDGSRIVFATKEPLSPSAVNGLEDIYEWHQGAVSIVSSGHAEEADQSPVLSPSGRDLFFTTTQGLLPQDADGARDVYDARLGGGFPPEPAPRQPCSGDACQGPLTNPAPLLVPASVSQPLGDNVSAKRHPHKKRHKRKAAARARKPVGSAGRSGR